MVLSASRMQMQMLLSDEKFYVMSLQTFLKLLGFFAIELTFY